MASEIQVMHFRHISCCQPPEEPVGGRTMPLHAANTSQPTFGTAEKRRNGATGPPQGLQVIYMSVLWGYCLAHTWVSQLWEPHELLQTDRKCHWGLPIRDLVTWVASGHSSTSLWLLLAWRSHLGTSVLLLEVYGKESAKMLLLQRGRQERKGKRRHFAFRYACMCVQDREIHLPWKSAISNVKKMTTIVVLASLWQCLQYRQITDM